MIPRDDIAGRGVRNRDAIAIFELGRFRWATTLDTLATALYASTDDLLKAKPDAVPWRPVVGLQARITDMELVTVAVLQLLLGFTSERRWLRHACVDLIEWFPHLPGQPGYTLRLRYLGKLSRP